MNFSHQKRVVMNKFVLFVMMLLLSGVYALSQNECDDEQYDDYRCEFDEYSCAFDSINGYKDNNHYDDSCNGSNDNGFVYHRVGRFSHEDSFDVSCVDDVISAAPVAVRKIIINLLYPPKNKAALPKRLLLVGKPGTGKTTLAKAIAHKCGYDYYVIEAPFLLNEYKNSGPQNLLREIYPLLQAGKPIVVILDELTELTDRYKKENDSDATVGAALWILLDSCAQFDNVFFIGTSNKAKKDLPAQLQSRFDEDIITIHMPHTAARKRILQRHLKDERHKIDKNFLQYLIKKTNGRSAREIEKLVFKAIQFANTRTPHRYTVMPVDFERALKLWKSWWHPMIIYQTIEPHLQPFFKTAFPIILQAIGLVHSIYSTERQHRNTERGLALQEASYVLQEVGQAMQERAHKESMNHQGEVFTHQKEAHNESMDHQREALAIHIKMHDQSIEHQEKVFDHQQKVSEESKQQQEKALKHQQEAHDASMKQQKEQHEDSVFYQWTSFLAQNALPIIKAVGPTLSKFFIRLISRKGK
jgi:AAA+ superfamily predicted ATPase